VLDRPDQAARGPQAHAGRAVPTPPIPLEQRSDAELVALCLAGEREGFTVLTRRYGATVVAFAFSRLGDRDHAEEVAQESLVRAFERLWSLKAPRVFASWLLGIANNVVLQELDRRSRSVPLEEAPEATSGDAGGPAAASSAGESRARMLREVNALPPHYRLTMLLKYQEHLSCEEIALRIGVSEGTVRSRLARAYRLLREVLADYEEDL